MTDSKTYKTDDERKQSWEEAVASSELNAKTYRRFNYSLIDVPNDSPEKKADFILADPQPASNSLSLSDSSNYFNTVWYIGENQGSKCCAQ